MKKALLLALAVLVLGTNAFAAVPSEGRINVNTGLSVVTGGSTTTEEKNTWSAGLSYEQAIQDSLAYVVGANYMQHNVENATYVVEAGLRYDICDKTYAIAALNYNFVTDATAKGSEVDPQLGYRIGLGYNVSKEISTELSFEQLNKTVDRTNIKFDTVKVAAIYHF